MIPTDVLSKGGNPTWGQPQHVQYAKQVSTVGQSLEESLRGLQANGGREQLLAQPRANIHFLERKLEASPPRVKQAVEIDVRVMHGNPVFRGSRVPLYRIIEELAEGTSIAQLEEGYPSLDREKIQAGLDYAAALLRIYDD